MHMNEQPKPKQKAQCPTCGAWLAHIYRLKMHMLIHTDPVKCDECDVTLAHQQSYRRHFYQFHKDGGTNHKCHLCTKSFRTASDLQVHTALIVNSVHFLYPGAKI